MVISGPRNSEDTAHKMVEKDERLKELEKSILVSEFTEKIKIRDI
jgi:hypothetical protein